MYDEAVLFFDDLFKHDHAILNVSMLLWLGLPGYIRMNGKELLLRTP
jgi:hypothetical protein